MKPIKTHTFNGVKHDIDLGACYGYCDSPKVNRPTLWIDIDNIPEHRKLEIVIHEALHACDFRKSEVAVTQIAKDLSRFIKRMRDNDAL